MHKQAVFKAAVAAGIAAALLILWNHGVFLPRWIAWESRQFQDSSATYGIELIRKKVTVTCGSTPIWSTPDGVKVQQALSCDIDRDDEDELVLLCWKIGRYGTHRPFWVERDEKKWSQHLFVYEYNKGEIRPKWMSSYIGQDVAGLGTDSRAANVSRLLMTDLDGNISRWVWDSWGFSKEDTDVTVTVFGDNLIHEPLYRYGLAQGGSFAFLFENLKETILKSDISVINQETPLVESPSMYSGYPRFGTPSGVGEAIAKAGFDVVTCATNHALDKGAYGINTTKSIFDAGGLTCLGIQLETEGTYRPYELLTKKGVRFALLNYTYGTNGIRMPEANPYMVHRLEDEGKIKADIAQAKADADLVLIFVHWGTEYARQPDESQKKWTQVFLDSKADVVIGTHPHALQPYEVLTDGTGHEMLVYYSIGNYISAQPEPSCIKGGMARFTISLAPEGYKISSYSLQPLTITRHKGGRYAVSFWQPMKFTPPEG